MNESSRLTQLETDLAAIKSDLSRAEEQIAKLLRIQRAYTDSLCALADQVFPAEQSSK
jgi:hypothetical protein